jgi:hypothetical protein
MAASLPRRSFLTRLASGLGFSILPWPLYSSGFTNPIAALLTEKAAATVGFHLTARPWKAIGTTRDELLDAVEALCRFAAKHLDEDGAFIDPILGSEHQYATPYFDYAAATLIHAGPRIEVRLSGKSRASAPCASGASASGAPPCSYRLSAKSKGP